MDIPFKSLILVLETNTTSTFHPTTRLSTTYIHLFWLNYIISSCSTTLNDRRWKKAKLIQIPADIGKWLALHGEICWSSFFLISGEMFSKWLSSWLSVFRNSLKTLNNLHISLHVDALWSSVRRRGSERYKRVMDGCVVSQRKARREGEVLMNGLMAHWPTNVAAAIASGFAWPGETHILMQMNNPFRLDLLLLYRKPRAF